MPKRSAGETESLWLSVISDGASEAASEGAKDAAASALLLLLPSAIAGPGGAAIAAMLKALFSKAEERAAQIAGLVQVVLDEPFQTATRTLQMVAGADLSSKSEIAEAKRQLQTAYDNFSKAYSYARKNNPDRGLLILIYQGITAALLPGGKPFARQIVKTLRNVCGPTNKARATANLTEALQELDALSRNYGLGLTAASVEGFARGTLSTSENTFRVGWGNSHKDALDRKNAAAAMIHTCQTVELSCDLIETLLAR